MGRGHIGVALALGLVAAGSARAACQLQQYVQLPVTIEGGGAVVSAKLNGADARLTVDTGAFFSMLNPSAVAKFGLRTEPLPAYISVHGMTGGADPRLTTVKEFSVLGVPLHRVDFLVGEHSVGSADGLLGQNLLSILDTEFDFSSGAIRLMKPQGCGDAPLAYWSQDSHAYGAMSIDPIEPPNQQIVGSVAINGVRLRALFDTGAQRSVLSLAGARRAGVKTTDPGVIGGGVWGGIGRKLTETWIAPFNLVDIGGEQVKNTRLRIADINLADADMVIGVDFFLSHRIYVSKSQHKLYFTYNGGPVFNLEVRPPTGAAAPTTTTTTPAGPPSAGVAASAAPATDTPTDAAGFTRRGDAFLARREFAEAVADFDHAAALEPNDPQHVYDRARARLQNHQPLLALSDLNQALTLKADDVPALMLRGQMRLVLKDSVGAKADFDAALSHDASVGLRVADAYARAGSFEAALADYDLWIASHPKNEDLARPLNGRCWVRALWGHDLDKALADCNEALRLWPGAPQVLDSRGLVFLRMNLPDKAIADYDAAIKLAPQTAWSLYGRGLAKLRLGRKAEGDTDIAAAVAISPRIADEAKKNGVGP
ncbi:MAG TPA: aspartyl protease family protein [Caulobacteraceae bacterium]|nr:aspartyl protease family protein [Caulobacteraceae bacterium]